MRLIDAEKCDFEALDSRERLCECENKSKKCTHYVYETAPILFQSNYSVLVAASRKSFIGHDSKQVWHLCVLIKNLYSDDNFCVDTYSKIIHVYID